VKEMRFDVVAVLTRHPNAKRNAPCNKERDDQPCAGAYRRYSIIAPCPDENLVVMAVSSSDQPGGSVNTYDPSLSGLPHGQILTRYISAKHYLFTTSLLGFQVKMGRLVLHAGTIL
jgi:hypothetical protein